MGARLPPLDQFVRFSPGQLNYARAGRKAALEGTAMPVYEFKCSKCEHVFEVMGSYAEREKAQTCPKCGGTEVKHVISVVSVKPPSGSF
jgi:putative FmdB family regulatory protein